MNSLPFTLITIYRPPKNSIPCFLEEIDNLLSSLSSRTILLGDFNIPISLTSTYAKLLNQTINSHNCVQHITSPTHSSGNILDLIISHITSNIISNTSVQNLITDHHIVTFFLQAPTPKRQSKIITFRKIQNIDLPAFKKDFLSNNSIILDPINISSIDLTLINTLDILVPIKTKSITQRHNIKWFNPTLNLIKRQLRAAEKTWRKSKTHEHLNSFKQISYTYRRMIKKAKHDYYTDTIISAGNNYKKLFKISNSLLGRTTPRILTVFHLSTQPTLIITSITRYIESLIAYPNPYYHH